MKIEVSNGELVDKVTILHIKSERVTDPVKLMNIRNEFELLKADMNLIGISSDSESYQALITVNTSLWEIEDKIRIKEYKQEFDSEFISLARSVYFENDKRSEIKKEINLQSGSYLVEEKQYIEYKNQ